MPVEVDGVTLAGEQLNCYERFLEEHRNGKKVLWCVLGLAGTGKTALLKAFQKRTEDELGGPKCLATAPFKLAAQNIGAKTIHSTFIQPFNGKPDNARQVAIDRMNDELSDIDVLLIDNINFVSDESFLWIDKRLREARDPQRPFGGISVICFGDFYQQGPIGRPSIYEDRSQALGLWRLFELFELTKNYRFQSEEERIVLKTVATLSEEAGALTDEARALINETKEYLKKRHLEGGNAQEVATKLRGMRDGNEMENAKFAVFAPANDMIDDVLKCLDPNAIGTKFYPREPSVVKLDFDSPDKKDFTVTRGNSIIFESLDNNTSRRGRFDGSASVKRINPVGPASVIVEDVCNYHMSRGQTFDGVIIVRKFGWGGRACSLNDGELYGLISRAKSLENCWITPSSPLNWKVSAGANKEMERLRFVKDTNRLRAANNQPINP